MKVFAILLIINLMLVGTHVFAQSSPSDGGEGGHTSTEVMTAVSRSKHLLLRALDILKKKNEPVAVHGKFYDPQIFIEKINFDIVICKPNFKILKRGTKIHVCDDKLSEFVDVEESDIEVFAVAYPSLNKVFFSSKKIMEVQPINRSFVLFAEVFHELAHMVGIGKDELFPKNYNEHAELSQAGLELFDQAFIIANKYEARSKVPVNFFLCNYPPEASSKSREQYGQYLLIKAWEQAISLQWWRHEDIERLVGIDWFKRNFSTQMFDNPKLGLSFSEIRVVALMDQHIGALTRTLSWTQNTNDSTSIVTLHVPKDDDQYRMIPELSNNTLTLFESIVDFEIGLKDHTSGAKGGTKIDLPCITVARFETIENVSKFFETGDTFIK